MKLVLACVASLLVASSAAAPSSDEDIIEFLPSIVYKSNYIVYTGKHDIVDIVTPLNSINFSEDDIKSSSSSESSSSEESDINYTFFFVEADVDDKGKKDYKGLYIHKHGKATKILEAGTDIAVTVGQNSLAYLAAKDGIYIYDDKTKKVEKYGTLGDSIISIAKENRTDDLYILTEDHVVYKVTDEGTKKVKIAEAEGAQQIVLDWDDNLYYYGADKQPHAIAFDGIKEIKGLPASPNSVKLIKPPITLDSGAGFLSDDRVYIIFANGTSELTEFRVTERPTAASLEGTLIHYYGHDKKIYKFNLFTALRDQLSDEVKRYVDTGNTNIVELKDRLRKD